MAKLPYMQFYTGDWMKDQAVRASSLAARGLWFDLLCFMWESPDRGLLKTPSGSPMTPDHISRMVGESPQRVRALLDELRNNGVYDEVDGCIANRRMVRASRLSEVRAKAAVQKWSKHFAMQNGVHPSEDEVAVLQLQNSTSESESETTAAASIWSVTAKTIRDRFPATDDALIARIAAAAQAEYAGITDWQLANIVVDAYAGKERSQRSAALFLKTVPPLVRQFRDILQRENGERV